VLAGFDASVDPGDQHTPRGQRQVQVAQLKVVDGRVGHHRWPYTGAVLFLVKNDCFVEAGRRFTVAFKRRSRLRADEPGKCALHLAEGI